MATCGHKCRPKPTRLLSTVQIFAWVDMILFLVLIGPTILLSLATETLQPSYRTKTVIVDGHTEVLGRHIALYDVERPPSATEEQVIRRIRRGCGRNYARNIPFIWEHAKEHLTDGMTFFTTSLVASFASSLLFLIIVPSSNWIGHVYPAIHLFLQLSSVITSLLGVHNLVNRDICLLDYIIPDFRIQVAVVTSTFLMTFTYKLYEISLIDAYIRLHFRSLAVQAEHKRQQQMLGAVYSDEIPPDKQLQNIIDQLTQKKNKGGTDEAKGKRLSVRHE